MFASGDFEDSIPPSQPQPFHTDRLIGALILLAFLILCLALSLGLDSAVFVPFNGTQAPTLTAKAKITGTPTSRTPAPRRSQTALPRPSTPKQEVRAD